MLESLTAIRRSRFVCISRVVILIIGLLLILRFQIILVIVSFLEFLLFISVKFIVVFNMAVNVMQSVTFKLNISDSLHSAQTNTAIANEAKRTVIFANGNSVGGSGGHALELPKMNALGSLILFGQHFVTAQFH